MIAIVNVGPHDDPDKLGVRTYEVRINANVVCTFKHRRADGLGMCLLKASKAVERQKWEQASERELAAMTAEKMKYRARALHAESQLDELHACLKEAMEWCKPCNYEREPWLRWAKARDSHKPNPEAHGRRSRTVQPIVGSLDGDK